jgi:hypothetical protein
LAATTRATPLGWQRDRDSRLPRQALKSNQAMRLGPEMLVLSALVKQQAAMPTLEVTVLDWAMPF